MYERIFKTVESYFLSLILNFDDITNHAVVMQVLYNDDMRTR